MSDLRKPIGFYFSLLGVLLLIVNFAQPGQSALGPANVNLYCGLAMLVFGSVMLWLARRTS